MTAEERSERIEQYVRGLLNQEEALAFEKEMATDTVLAEEVALEKDLLESLSETDVRAFRHTLETVQRKKHTARIIPMASRRRWAIATSVLVLVLAGYYIMDRIFLPDPQSLYQAYFEIPEAEEFMIPAIFRSRDTDRGDNTETAAEQTLQNVAALYRSGAYAEALEKMLAIQLPSDSKEAAGYAYQLGVCYLVNDQPTNALESLVAGQEANPSGARWYQAMALLQLNRPDEAREKLEELRSEPSPWQDKAIKLLRKL